MNNNKSINIHERKGDGRACRDLQCTDAKNQGLKSPRGEWVTFLQRHSMAPCTCAEEEHDPLLSCHVIAAQPEYPRYRQCDLSDVSLVEMED